MSGRFSFCANRLPQGETAIALNLGDDFYAFHFMT
jgi:hypothetical protein